MFFFSVSRSRQISSVYVRARARAQHTRDKFFPSRTRSIVRKRKKERKEGKKEDGEKKEWKSKEGRGRGLFAKTKHYRLLLNRVVIAIYRKRKKK